MTPVTMGPTDSGPLGIYSPCPLARRRDRVRFLRQGGSEWADLPGPEKAKGRVLRLVRACVVLEDDGTLVGVTEVVLEIEGRPETYTLKGKKMAGARVVPGDELLL